MPTRSGRQLTAARAGRIHPATDRSSWCEAPKSRVVYLADIADLFREQKARSQSDDWCGFVSRRVRTRCRVEGRKRYAPSLDCSFPDVPTHCLPALQSEPDAARAPSAPGPLPWQSLNPDLAMALGTHIAEADGSRPSEKLCLDRGGRIWLDPIASSLPRPARCRWPLLLPTALAPPTGPHP